MQIPPVSGQEWPAPAANPVAPWLDHLRRVSYLRGHISVYAVGSVVLLAANLLFGSGNVWADTAIMAWGVLLVVHALVAVIARLLQELLVDDEPERGARPVQEMRWNAPSTWAIQPRQPRSRENQAATADPSPSAPSAPPAPEAPATSSDKTDRVSWKAATAAAWLAPRDDGRDTSSTNDVAEADKETQDGDNGDENDFTPLKLD